jgi:uncharacterized protein (DUF1697 family)
MDVTYMKYVALLRGINVGKQKRLDMKKLRELFESLGHKSVSTYINSGNVIFESDKKQADVRKVVEAGIEKAFGFHVSVLIKTCAELRRIAEAIPKGWENDSTQRSDVAYLFPEIDSRKTIDMLPVKSEYVDVRYVEGAIYWNVKRKDRNKSQLGKLIGHRIYQQMTVRNVNTARYLARTV